MKLIRLTHAEIEYTDYGCVTRFPDGTETQAWPHPDQHHQHVIAHRCGYGDDIIAYTREHEVCHSIVEEFFHSRPSRVLWGVAHNAMLTGLDSAYEEMATQALQRFVRANERPILAGVNWDRLRAVAVSILGDKP